MKAVDPTIQEYKDNFQTSFYSLPGTAFMPLPNYDYVNNKPLNLPSTEKDSNSISKTSFQMATSNISKYAVWIIAIVVLFFFIRK